MQKLRSIPHSASGQSLIETIVAIFVLTTALTAGLGLTIYAFSAATTSQNEIIASNLAREGIEVVRMMRDSNWLAGDAAAGASDLAACADIGSRLCYPQAFSGPTYNLGTGNFRVDFNPLTRAWSRSNTTAYYLYRQADGTYSSVTNGSSVFARMISTTNNSSAPYTAANPEVIVKSVVAWRGKNCPEFTTNQDLLTLVSACKIMVEEHMTNWKDYK